MNEHSRPKQADEPGVINVEPGIIQITQGATVSVRRTQWVVMALAAMATVGAGFSTLFSDNGSTTDRREPVTRASAPVENRLDDMDREVRRLQAAIGSLSDIPPARSRLASQVEQTERRVEGLGTGLRDLKAALTPDPVEALRVATLQQSLRRVESTTAGSLGSMRADIDRQYDLMKFVVGTLAIGLLGLMATLALPLLARGRGEGSQRPSAQETSGRERA